MCWSWSTPGDTEKSGVVIGDEQFSFQSASAEWMLCAEFHTSGVAVLLRVGAWMEEHMESC